MRNSYCILAAIAQKCSQQHGGFAMAHWATSPLDRNQVVLFAPTLDQSIPDEHSVRLFSETLAALDFSKWELMYVRLVGQPPIHPRVLAGCILYGLSLGIRSSRKLEDAAANRLDFIWLLEGRVPDHATICKFRTQFGKEIKDLFRQVGRVAITMGLVSLNQVLLDGSEFKANNSRYATNRRPSLQQKLDGLDRQIEQMLAETDLQDKTEDQLFGEGSPAKLPKALQDLKTRQERLRQAMKNLEKLEKDRGNRKDTTKAPAIRGTPPCWRPTPSTGSSSTPR
jgi:transposase